MEPNAEEDRGSLEEEVEALPRFKILQYRVGHGLDRARIDHFLVHNISWLSRARAQKFIAGGAVSRKGVPFCKPATRVIVGDVIDVAVEDEHLDAEQLENLNVPIVYEDDALLVVDKPPFLAVHANHRYLTVNLVDYLAHVRSGKVSVYDPTEFRLVHRLDRETSGLVLLSKDKRIHPQLSEQWEDHSAIKVYLALISGILEPPTGTIDAPIGTAICSEVRLKQGVNPEGLPARTSYKTVAALGAFSIVALRLFTGRQHQIRVHLSHLGSPVVGDKLYGPDERYFLESWQGRLPDIGEGGLLAKRQLLHAYGLAFVHPGSGEILAVKTAFPGDFRAFLQSQGLWRDEIEAFCQNACEQLFAREAL